jgi:hypothetical protein
MLAAQELSHLTAFLGKAIVGIAFRYVFIVKQ